MTNLLTAVPDEDLELSTAVPTCAVCVAAEAEGCWPAELRAERLTHCPNCHRTWFGAAQMHCVVCHEQFSSASVCDTHKDGTRCVDPARVEDRDGNLRLELQETVHGPVWTLQGAVIGVGTERRSA